MITIFFMPADSPWCYISMLARQRFAFLQEHPLVSAGIYWFLKFGHMKVQLYQDTIMHYNTAMPIYEEIRKDELATHHKDG